MGAKNDSKYLSAASSSSNASLLSDAPSASVYLMRRIGANVLKYGSLIPVTLSFAFPLYWMIVSALKNDSQVYTIPPILLSNPIHLSNFPEGWAVFPFTLYAFNSLIHYVIPVVVLTILSSTIVAYVRGFAFAVAR